MPEKRKKRKRKTKPASSGGTTRSVGVSPSEPQSGGLLQSMRSGFRRAAGAEAPEKESTTSKVIWGVIFAVAIAVLIARFLGLWGDEEQPRESDPPARAPTKVEPPDEPEAAEPEAAEPEAAEPEAAEPEAAEPEIVEP